MNPSWDIPYLHWWNVVDDSRTGYYLTIVRLRSGNISDAHGRQISPRTYAGVAIFQCFIFRLYWFWCLLPGERALDEILKGNSRKSSILLRVIFGRQNVRKAPVQSTIHAWHARWFSSMRLSTTHHDSPFCLAVAVSNSWPRHQPTPDIALRVQG